jgi:hypothetical protein
VVRLTTCHHASSTDRFYTRAGGIFDQSISLWQYNEEVLASCMVCHRFLVDQDVVHEVVLKFS